MEALYIYLIKSSGLIALFYLAYHFMLRKETFFTSNRWFLLLGLLTSVVLPLVDYTKIIIVESSSKNMDWSRIPVTTSIENEAFEINWYLIFGTAYGIGIVLFLVKFAFDFYSLNIVLKGQTIQNQADFKFIDTTENIAPFSYFNTIVYNSSLYSNSELENILEHEKVHSEQNHTVDVLISRLFCIFFWFNPLIWLYKKAILQNLEFIADSEATKKISDKKAYQFTLLKITTHENCVAITNHFYQSLIKKRIVMLNKNQSNKRNSWKYALILPVLVAFMLYFQVKVVAQERNTPTKVEETESWRVVITKNCNDEYIQERCRKIKEQTNIDLKFSNIKRNKKGEITNITTTFNDNKGTKDRYTQSNTSGISNFMFSYKKNENGTSEIGIYDDVTSEGKRKEQEDNDTYTEVATEEVAPLAQETPIAIADEVTNIATEVPEPPAAPAVPSTPRTTTVTNETYKKGGKTIHKQITIVNGKRITDTEVSADDDSGNSRIEMLSPDDAAQIKHDIEQAKRDGIQAIEDRKQAIEDRKQAIQDRKQVIEDRKQAIEDRKQGIEDRRQALRDRKQELKDTQTAIMKAN